MVETAFMPKAPSGSDFSRATRSRTVEHAEILRVLTHADEADGNFQVLGVARTTPPWPCRPAWSTTSGEPNPYGIFRLSDGILAIVPSSTNRPHGRTGSQELRIRVTFLSSA